MLDFTTLQFVYIGLAVFAGGILRGISGFGFSLTLIVILTLFMPPILATALIFIWEISASILHLPFVWRQVDWKALKWLSIGIILGTPFGVWLVMYIPPTPMTVLINGTVIILSIIMLRGYTLKRNLTPLEMIGTGTISGIINGASANGGPPVILLFFSSPAGVHVGRASLIAFFLFTDIFASTLFASQGLMGKEILITSLYYIPWLALGIYIGSKLYSKINEVLFKRFVIILLIVISAFGCIKAII